MSEIVIHIAIGIDGSSSSSSSGSSSRSQSLEFPLEQELLLIVVIIIIISQQGHMLQGLPSSLPTEGSLPSPPLGLSPGNSDGLGHGGGGNAGGAKEDGGHVLVNDFNVGIDTEEGEIGFGARRAEERRGWRRREDAVGMSERGALGAREALGWRRRGRIVKSEAGRAEGGRVEEEDTGGAETPVYAAEADMVEEEAILRLGAAVATFCC